MEFAEKLKNIRISKGWSQEEVAERSGISRRTIQNYESGNMLPKKHSTYKVLAETFGVEEAVLVDSNIDFVHISHCKCTHRRQLGIATNTQRTAVFLWNHIAHT